MIEGVAVTARINSNKQSFNPLGCELSLPVPLLFQHDPVLIGEVVYACKSETEVFIRATIFPDEAGYAAWQLIKVEGTELTGLSIGIGYGRNQFHIIEKDGVDYFTKFRLSEVSVCFEPGNRDCRFKIYPGGAQKMVHPSKTKALETIARLDRKYGPTNRQKLVPNRQGGIVHKRYDNVIHKKLASDKTNTDLDFVLSDSSVDRYGDIILSTGWILDNFKRNPVALFAHRGDFPVGQWKNLRVSDGALRGTLQLAPLGTSERVDEVVKLVSAGILKAVSVGFKPLKSKPRPGDEPGIIYMEQELVECSVVAIPANSNALAIAKKLNVSAATQALVFKNRRT